MRKKRTFLPETYLVLMLMLHVPAHFRGGSLLLQ